MSFLTATSPLVNPPAGTYQIPRFRAWVIGRRRDPSRRQRRDHAPQSDRGPCKRRPCRGRATHRRREARARRPLDRDRLERPDQSHVVRDARLPEALRLQQGERDEADAPGPQRGKAVVSSGTREKAEYDVALHGHGLWATMRQDSPPFGAHRSSGCRRATSVSVSPAKRAACFARSTPSCSRFSTTTSHQQSPQVTPSAASAGLELTHDDPR
jgi:hypothetical protein